MSVVEDFLRWYDKINVVPSLEAMQKMIAFYYDKNVDLLKLGCTLPHLANICLHNSDVASFYLIRDGDNDLSGENLRRCVC